MPDGRVQLMHKSTDALDFEQAELGILFMTDMFELSKKQNYKIQVQENDYKPMSIVVLNAELKEFHTGVAQFGLDLRHNLGIIGRLTFSNPMQDACTPFPPAQFNTTTNRIVVARRGNCMFVDKARHVQNAGGIGLIVIDNTDETSYSTSPMFAMSGDGTADQITIPALFLFGKEGRELQLAFNFDKSATTGDLFVFMGDNSVHQGLTGVERSLTFNSDQFKSMYKPSKYGHLSRCNRRAYYFGLKKNRRRMWERSSCAATDAVEFAEVYTKVYRIADPWAGTITLQYDDVISIRFYSERHKILLIDLSSLMKIDDQSMAALNGTEQEQQEEKGLDRASRVFKLLFDHFQKKTKLLGFKRAPAYMKSLFSFVNSKVNPQTARFSDEDRANFEALADDMERRN
jgi:hypothetical protein